MTTQVKGKSRKNRKRKRRSSKAHLKRVQRKYCISLNKLEPSFTGRARFSVYTSDRHRQYIGIIVANSKTFTRTEIAEKVKKLCNDQRVYWDRVIAFAKSELQTT